ncbi:O-acetylhomoserine aminocarboxypropyltransferase [Insolitispirillum peregrinum]|uniref:O-acetylhomoserine aminocarboxypropyltransferase n=1 Tax=Insolitispirillum peregrinum TaxID=80876 RepID=UPI0036166E1F
MPFLHHPDLLPEDPTAPIPYPDGYLRAILSSVRTIALVGASANSNRPSHFVMKYLQEKGYRVIPVNPGQAGKEILGEPCYGSLADIPERFEMVDIFRASEAAAGVTDEAIALAAHKGIHVIWMQLSVRHDEAAHRAEQAGLQVVMNRCPKIEFGRLCGELSWSGVNTGIISSRVRTAPKDGSTPHGRSAADGLEDCGFETRAVHAGASPDPVTGARITPIYQTSSYVFEDSDHAASLFNLHTFGHVYSRMSNPTVSVLEERVANLEGGRAAVACASGHAAQFLTFFTLLEPGDEFLASRNLYGGSVTQFSQSFKKLGWHCTFIDPTAPETFRAAITPRTKAIFLEVLANPGGAIVDVETIASIAHEAGIPLIVDNTLATPYLCRPIEWGADIVVHSTTKFLSGHGNALGGVVVESGRFNWSASDKFPSLSRPEPAYHGLVFHETFGDFAFTTKARAVALRDFGPALAPMNAFLTLTGIETLHLRMDRHVANARAVATFLSQHPAVAHVSWAGLPNSPHAPLAAKYFPLGAGSVFTVTLKGGYQAGKRLVERVKIFSHLANIGDTRSLVLHPASTTHRQLSPEQRASAGAGDAVVRLSIGIERAEDLIRDLEQALAEE